MSAHPEDTARAKQCPVKDQSCQGSNCMAWRWAKPPAPRKIMCAHKGAIEEPNRPTGVPESYEWMPAKHERKPGAYGFDYEAAHWREPKRERRGYCGLAGHP